MCFFVQKDKWFSCFILTVKLRCILLYLLNVQDFWGVFNFLNMIIYALNLDLLNNNDKISITLLPLFFLRILMKIYRSVKNKTLLAQPCKYVVSTSIIQINSLFLLFHYFVSLTKSFSYKIYLIDWKCLISVSW